MKEKVPLIAQKLRFNMVQIFTGTILDVRFILDHQL